MGGAVGAVWSSQPRTRSSVEHLSTMVPRRLGLHRRVPVAVALRETQLTETQPSGSPSLSTQASRLRSAATFRSRRLTPLLRTDSVVPEALAVPGVVGSPMAARTATVTRMWGTGLVTGTRVGSLLLQV